MMFEDIVSLEGMYVGTNICESNAKRVYEMKSYVSILEQLTRDRGGVVFISNVGYGRGQFQRWNY